MNYPHLNKQNLQRTQVPKLLASLPGFWDTSISTAGSVFAFVRLLCELRGTRRSGSRRLHNAQTRKR